MELAQRDVASRSLSAVGSWHVYVNGVQRVWHTGDLPNARWTAHMLDSTGD
jgi:hypothetical protein